VSGEERGGAVSNKIIKKNTALRRLRLSGGCAVAVSVCGTPSHPWWRALPAQRRFCQYARRLG
jgi:hypothetical protein